MELAALTIPIERLSRWEEPWDQDLAIVRLDGGSAHAAYNSRDVRLPACPVIGVGGAGKVLAADYFDAMVESPSELETIVRSVRARPLAARTLVQVLRTTGELSAADALTVESLAYAMLQGSAEHARWLAGRIPGPEGPHGQVVIERTGDQLDIILSRPSRGNAIDRSMRDGLASALALAALDPGISRVRLRALGKAFSLGADLDEFGTTTDPATAHAIRMRTLPARAAIDCADRLEVHVDGACVGAGLELAAFASRVTATSRSWFQLPELAMGIIPGAGGCVSLPRRIGRQRTALMVLSGRRIGARQALEWGLVDALMDDPAGDEGGEHIV